MSDDFHLHAYIKAFLDMNYPCCKTKGCPGEEEEAWEIVRIVKKAGYSKGLGVHHA